MADSSEPQQQSEAVCNFFRKPSKNKNIRKRTLDEDDNEDEDSKAENLLLHNKKKTPRPDNKLHFSTGASKRSLSSESNVESSAPIFQFESSKEIQVQNDSRATATLETETDFSRDARAIRERQLKQAEAELMGKSKNPEGEKLYKGIHGYTDYKAGFRREQTVSSEKAGGSHGPLRASAHIRVSARFDYQPDICKDYKETGYCGYGDSCKFMHDRGDYKSGWQMEKDWEEAEKARKRNLALGGDDMDEGAAAQSDEDDEALPFACFICRQPFVDPVVTRCKHYFCEHCALKHHAKNKKCFVCNKKTDGIFNAAHEIKKKMAAEGAELHTVNLTRPSSPIDHFQFFADLLGELNLNVREIHSRKPQSYRTRVSDEFRKSEGLILVTSDVSARGVDYPDVTVVIQVGLPSDREQYVHRLGRTGRKGKEGQGILLLAPWEESFLSSIKDLPIAKGQIPSIDLETNKKVERALSHVEMKNKAAAYQAWLGYYNSNKIVGRDKSRLMELANEFSRCMGICNPPAIPKLVLGKMGLRNIPGLRSK